MEDKHCPTCNKFKQTSNFHKDKYSSDGFHAICKLCRSQRYYKKRVKVDESIISVIESILHLFKWMPIWGKRKHIEKLQQIYKHYLSKNDNRNI